MKLRLEQLYYGSGPRGYAVLGASVGAAPFSARAESLCGGVGTPPGDWNGVPFLLSLPVGEHVLMACCRRGEPDSMGRGTLFFHVLAASRQDLEESRADAFSLFAAGAFVTRMPGDAVDVLTIEVNRDGDRVSSGPRAEVAFPAFLRSNEPLPGVVRTILGDRGNERSWATFAFRAMKGFDLQVIPNHVPAPMGAKECDASGRTLQHDGKPQNNAMPKSGGGGMANSRDFPAPISAQLPSQTQPKSSAMSKLSFAANAVLAILCVFLFVSRRQEGGQPVSSPENPGSAASAEELTQTKTEAERLSAANAELSRRIAEIEDKNRELALEIERAKGEAADRFLESMPEYFTEKQCDETLTKWDRDKNNPDHLYHILHQWIHFFDEHPKSQNNPRGTQP